MASTITRDIWTDDSGTAALPAEDGTLIGNDELQDHIYARIDQMFAGAGAYATFTFGGHVALETGKNLTVPGIMTAGAVAPTFITAGSDAIAVFLKGRLADNIARLLFLNNTGASAQAAIDGAPGGLLFSTGTTPSLRMTINAGGDIKVEVPTNGHDLAASEGNAILSFLRGRSSDGIARLLWVNSTAATTHAAIDGLANELRLLTGTTPTLRLSIGNDAIVPSVRINSSPAQPGFLAYNSADDAGQASGTPVQLDTEVFDNASNVSFNQFVAPVTGQYLFCGTVAVEADTVGVTLDLQLETGSGVFPLDRVVNASSGAAYILGGSSYVNLTAGEAADLKVYTSSGTVTILGAPGGSRQSRFSGRLCP